MKHAGTMALDRLDELLTQLRALGAMRETSRGVFYVKAKAFLHFHEDPKGLFADLRAGTDFERFPVNSASEHMALLAAVKARLGAAG